MGRRVVFKVNLGNSTCLVCVKVCHSVVLCVFTILELLLLFVRRIRWWDDIEIRSLREQLLPCPLKRGISVNIPQVCNTQCI